MESDEKIFQAWAYERIQELEKTVALLKDKIQTVETENAALVKLLSTLEERSKFDGYGEICRKLDTGDCEKESRNEGLPESNISPQVDVTQCSSEVNDFDPSGELPEPNGNSLPGEFSSIHLEEENTDEKVDGLPMTFMAENQAVQNDLLHGGGAKANLGHQVLIHSKKERQGRSLGNVVTRPIALRIMYLGSSYHGFASQGATQKTVESELFAALEHTKLLSGARAQAKYSRCGRTDKGVSATGQVIALQLRSKIRKLSSDSVFTRSAQSTESQEGHSDVDHDDEKNEASTWDKVAAARASRKLEERTSMLTAEAEDEIDYVGVLNRILPKDIRVLGWSPVPQDFHARFSCLYRQYKYFFVNEDLDMDAMKLACSKFIGDHDFRNFCKMDAANVHNYRRNISAFEILPAFEGCGRQVWVMRIRGTAFLWHQVRCMAAVVFMVGKGYESPNIVEDLLEVRVVTRKPQYKMASELPLVLQTCGFEGLSLHCPERASRHLQTHLSDMIKETILKLAILQEAVSALANIGECSGADECCGKEKQHVPLLRRLSEPSYEERRGRKIDS